MNTRKIEKELGWKPKETFGSGIQKTVEWYLENEDWVKQIMGPEYEAWIQKNYGERTEA